MSDLSKLLRSELDLIGRSSLLGLHRKIDPAMAEVAYLKAAEEIERLETKLKALQDQPVAMAAANS